MIKGGDRKTLIAVHTNLTTELEKLRSELSAYSEQDPVEMEKKAIEAQQCRTSADKFSDQILTMEGWLKDQMGAADREQMLGILISFYEAEFDEEEQGLRML